MTLASGIETTTLAQRPDLASRMWAMGDRIWPRFMVEDPVANLYYGRVETDFSDACLLVLDAGEVVARAFWIPFSWDGGLLPDRGWDAVVERGVADHDAGREPTAASALEIGIMPSHRGWGLSAVVLDAMRTAVANRGLPDLVAPVRPSRKSEFPHESMAAYLDRTTDGGLPLDPWLRVHVRAGGRIVGIAHESMHIPGTLAQWRAWTGVAFDHDGPTPIPGGLAPVQVDMERDTGLYVEPNVWVHHDLR